MARSNTVTGGDVSPSNDASKTALATNAGASPDEYKDEQDIGGSLDMVLSQGVRDSLMLEMREMLEQVTEGFNELTKPSDIYKMDQPFIIVGALTIEDYEDKNTGELKTKHIFRLQFEDGIVKNIMQSTARPRAVLAKMFYAARQLGLGVACGPYKFTEKATGKPQPALILAQQKGFACRQVNN